MIRNGTYKGNGTIIASSLEEFDLHVDGYLSSMPYSRGESEEYPTGFLPKIWREKHGVADLAPLNAQTAFTTVELVEIEKCRESLIRGEFDDRIFKERVDNWRLPIDPRSHEILHWLALAQHYEYRTRLLDVTRDHRVALYFAVDGAPGRSGFVFAWLEGNYNLVYDGRSVQRGGTPLDVEEIDDQYGPIHPQSDTLNAVDLPFSNRRVEAQKGAFVWTAAIVKESYKRGGLFIEIPADAKAAIKNELKQAGYDEEALFPR